jgi:hypothetical protein
MYVLVTFNYKRVRGALCITLRAQGGDFLRN